MGIHLYFQKKDAPHGLGTGGGGLVIGLTKPHGMGAKKGNENARHHCKRGKNEGTKKRVPTLVKKKGEKG